MKSALRSAWVVALAALTAGSALATPTTNVWNPNTDIQAKGVFHLGIDNYFSLSKNSTKALAFPTDVGLTYGLPFNIEVGIDLFYPTRNPATFNVKWAYPEKKDVPAIALGVAGIGIHKTTQTNQIYGLLAKSYKDYGRVTVGGYVANPNIVGKDNMGVIAAWDKTISDKWWVSVDYASGRNTLGAFSVGASYKFASNVGLIFGWVTYPKSVTNNSTFTTQLDIDF